MALSFLAAKIRTVKGKTKRKSKRKRKAKDLRVGQLVSRPIKFDSRN